MNKRTVVLSRWESVTGQSIIITELKHKLATVKSLKADFSSVSPSSERLEEFWVVCGLCVGL